MKRRSGGCHRLEVAASMARTGRYFSNARVSCEDAGMLHEADVPTRVALIVVSAFAPDRVFEVARLLHRSPFSSRHRSEFSALLTNLGGDPVETGIFILLRADDGRRRTPPELESLLSAPHSAVDAAMDAMAFAGYLEYRRDWRRDSLLRVGLSEHGRRLAEFLLVEYARGMRRFAVILRDEDRAAIEAVHEGIHRALNGARMHHGRAQSAAGG